VRCLSRVLPSSRDSKNKLVQRGDSSPLGASRSLPVDALFLGWSLAESPRRALPRGGAGGCDVAQTMALRRPRGLSSVADEGRAEGLWVVALQRKGPGWCGALSCRGWALSLGVLGAGILYLRQGRGACVRCGSRGWCCCGGSRGLLGAAEKHPAGGAWAWSSVWPGLGGASREKGRAVVSGAWRAGRRESRRRTPHRRERRW
jgi:hypothetical protein